MSLVLLTVPFLALGLVAGRFVAVIVPPLAWCVYFGGLAAGWWGSGVGEGWPFGLAALGAAGSVAAVAGVAVRRAISRARSAARRP